jgi:6-pyruvoyltetrahydropterin/6-carboxytetrahydropterin synthase
MKFELKQQFQIESARFLPHLSKDHPCSRLHGHSFVIILSFQGRLKSPEGWVIDYHEISTQMQPLLAALDHHTLNEVPGLENPTSENLCLWLYEKAKRIWPQELTKVTVRETTLTECSYPSA